MLGGNTITIAAAGSDTIAGAASAVIPVPYGYLALESNGASKWTVIDAAAFNGTAPIFAAHGSNIQCAVVEDLITCSGASSVSSKQIPNRAIVLAISVYVVTAITGATS